MTEPNRLPSAPPASPPGPAADAAAPTPMSASGVRAGMPAGVPALAYTLGYGGLLPFVAGAALIWFVDGDARFYVGMATVAYAATILGFLGGIHWGIAFRQAQPAPRLLLWGVVPSLVAWVALLMEPGAGLALAGAMLLVCYAVDRRIYRDAGVAHWLLLRFRLSAVAGLSCFVGAAGS